MPRHIGGTLASVEQAGAGPAEQYRVVVPGRTDRTHLGTPADVGRSAPPARAELIGTTHRREEPAVSMSDRIGWVGHDLRDALLAISCPARADDRWLDPAAGGAAAARAPAEDAPEEIEDFAALQPGRPADLTGSAR